MRLKTKNRNFKKNEAEKRLIHGHHTLRVKRGYRTVENHNSRKMRHKFIYF